MATVGKIYFLTISSRYLNAVSHSPLNQYPSIIAWDVAAVDKTSLRHFFEHLSCIWNPPVRTYVYLSGSIPFPLACNSYIIGSASGFLLVIGCGKNPKVLIINPFTGHSKWTKELPETTAPRPTYSIPASALASQILDFEFLSLARLGSFKFIFSSLLCERLFME